MSKFQKIKNFGPSASVVSFAYFQAFKFPDSMNVHFQCVIQVCRYNCPEPKCGGHGHHGGGGDFPAIGGPGGLGGDFGNQLHAEYGPPPLPHSEYGPPAFPDPRHPSGPTGAYSENKPEVVLPPLPPQAQQSTSSSDAPNPTTPTSQALKSSDVHMPPPPPPGHMSSYTTVKRKGTNADNEGNLATLGGRPRSVDPIDLQGVRRRRAVDEPINIVVTRVYKREAQEMTDVNTTRIIQVVAPGDVNFALNAAQSNETVVIQATNDPENICMSIPSFVGGLVMLLLVLVVSCLVAAFLFVRVRSFDQKGIMTTFVHPGYDNSEFVKVAN